jgi:hypothetical protein
MNRIWPRLLAIAVALFLAGTLASCGGDEHKDHKDHQGSSDSSR